MLKEDSQSLATHYDTKFVWQALLDYRAWVQALLYLYLLVPVYAISLFLPTIINSLGKKSYVFNVIHISYAMQVSLRQTRNF
jgi:hypothetical protein